MIKRIMMRILFIGVPILVVVWLMFLIGIQVYITPFYTYYFDGNMERKINKFIDNYQNFDNLKTEIDKDLDNI